MDRQARVTGRLEGNFYGETFGPLSGPFSARTTGGVVLLADGTDREIARGPLVRLTATQDALFALSNVTIGLRFHWERTEEQAFEGDLLLLARDDGTMAVINEIGVEEYLASVISSEMRATAPMEFLKVHAIMSRSWLLAALAKKKAGGPVLPGPEEMTGGEDEVVRWYEREEHDLFDVCADDHCQRYQGTTKIFSDQAKEAVLRTRGMVITYRGTICDARYSKACGGLTEEFRTAWHDIDIPYLASISDSELPVAPIGSEEDADVWVRTRPEAFCSTQDHHLLETILPDFDRETQDFFRWSVEYNAGELSEIVLTKSGLDLGQIKALIPLHRGPSGRISRLRILGSKGAVVVGKELEIRRWLSPSHLYSSAFVVEVKLDSRGQAARFTLNGAGWGHGVGLCQIGAAFMAGQGASAEQILKHYFRGVEMGRVY